MKRIIQLLIRWPFSCLILFGAGCKNAPAYNSFTTSSKDSIAQHQLVLRAYETIAKAKKIIETGDLVTRTGNDFTSESLRKLNQRDQTFSHCGVASIEHDTLFVYHALGGEFNPDQKIKRDLFEVFAEPYNNKGIGIFRFAITGEKKALVAATARMYQIQEVTFDMNFDLDTDDKMYCAEFVSKSFSGGSMGTIVFDHSRIKKFEFIGVDDIFLHPLSKEKIRVAYK